jgi:hypothetical protein
MNPTNEPRWLVGSVLIEGLNHSREALGLQDALAVQSPNMPSDSVSCNTGALSCLSTASSVVAVVCDGMSYGLKDGQTLPTRNQFGATLFSELITRQID